MKIIRSTVVRWAPAVLFGCAWTAPSAHVPAGDAGASTSAAPIDDNIRGRKPTAAEIPIR